MSVARAYLELPSAVTDGVWNTSLWNQFWKEIHGKWRGMNPDETAKKKYNQTGTMARNVTCVKSLGGKSR